MRLVKLGAGLAWEAEQALNQERAAPERAVSSCNVIETLEFVSRETRAHDLAKVLDDGPGGENDLRKLAGAPQSDHLDGREPLQYGVAGCTQQGKQMGLHEEPLGACLRDRAAQRGA